jgi:4-hydroxybenzoate polyprenyltransferase
MINTRGHPIRHESKDVKRRYPLLSCIRYREVLLLQGTPLMGAALAARKITAARLPALALLFAAGFLLVAHIWSLNDWADLHADRDHPHKFENTLPASGTRSGALLGFSLLLLAASLGLFALLPGRAPLLLAACIAFLGFFYSHASIHAKGNPLLSSITHLAGGLLHFLLGWCIFAPIGWQAVMAASFFALTFTAGHATQEVQDYDGDRLRNIRTNAVVFGKKTVFIAAFLVFTLAYADLLWLSLAGILPRPLWLFPCVILPVHAWWTLETLLRGLSHDRVARFRDHYRALFALIGAAMVFALFF